MCGSFGEYYVLGSKNGLNCGVGDFAIYLKGFFDLSSVHLCSPVRLVFNPILQGSRGTSKDCFWCEHAMYG